MSKISLYAIDASPTTDDKVIGTDVNNNNVTKNYRIGDIIGLSSFNITGDTGTAQTVVNGDTITFSGGVGLVTNALNNDTIVFTLNLNELPVSSSPTDAGYFAVVNSAGSQYRIASPLIPFSTFGAATNSVLMGGNRIINLGAPSAATDAATKQYVDNTFAGSGALIFQGSYDASTAPPTGAGILTGFTYAVTVAGDGAGFWSSTLSIGDIIIADSDNPVNESEWSVIDNNVNVATDTIQGIASFPTSGGLSISSGAVSLSTQASSGTFGDAANSVTLTIDGKGIVTSASESPIAITTSQITDFCSAVTACATSINLGNSNLTQTAATSRDYDLNGGSINFTEGVDSYFAIKKPSPSEPASVRLGYDSVAGSAVELKFYGSNAGYVALKSPVGVPTSYALTLPAAAGATGQVLVNDGSGTLSWQNNSTASVNLGNSDLTQTTFLRNYDLGSGTLAFNYGANTALTVSGSEVSLGANVPLRLRDNLGTNSVAIKSPDSLSSSYTLTLPPTDGVAGQVLKTDGDGVLDWVNSDASINLGSANLTQDGILRQYDLNGGASVLAFTNGSDYILTLNTAEVSLGANVPLRFKDNLGSNSVAIKSPNSLSSSYTLTLPVSDGNTGQVLKTDGSGVLDWTSVSNLGNSNLVQSDNSRSYDLGPGTLSFASGGSSALTLSGSEVSVGANIPLKLKDNTGTSSVGIVAPNSLSNVSYTLTLPNTDGNTGQILKTNGSGVLDWIDYPQAINLGNSDLTLTEDSSRRYNIGANKDLSFWGDLTSATPILTLNSVSKSLDLPSGVSDPATLRFVGDAHSLRFGAQPTEDYHIRLPSTAPSVNQQLSVVQQVGGTDILDWVDSGSKVTLGTAPASATATGEQGDVVWTTDYIYVCIAANTWKRVAIATW